MLHNVNKKVRKMLDKKLNKKINKKYFGKCCEILKSDIEM